MGKTVKDIRPIVQILRSDPSIKVLIEVELPEDKRHEFDSNYRSATGDVAEPGDHYHLISNKWGIELRLYLDAPNDVLDKLRPHCTVAENTGIHRDTHAYRINDNALISRLFREGFRLGPNAPERQ